MRTIKHVELGGGYSNKRKIIIDACELAPGEFEVMAMYENNGLLIDDEIESIATDTEQKAVDRFTLMIYKYAEPMQKAFLSSGLVPGGRYTLVYCNDFGFPVASKITFESMEPTTYAQHSDVVKMVFTPYRKRKQWEQFFYDKSVIIFEGWQDLKDEDSKITLRDDGIVKTSISKYAGFDSRYIDDLEHAFNNPLMVYKNYKVGVNGKLYA